MKIEIQIPDEEDSKAAEAEVEEASKNGVTCLVRFTMSIAERYGGIIVVKDYDQDDPIMN